MGERIFEGDMLCIGNGSPECATCGLNLDNVPEPPME